MTPVATPTNRPGESPLPAASLGGEAARLAAAWMRHEAGMLLDYLVQDVEDPRLNVQSILTRHFLAEELFGQRFAGLQEQELRFALAANWLLSRLRHAADADDFAAILHALQRGADDAEGTEIPSYIRRIFAAFPAAKPGGSEEKVKLELADLASVRETSVAGPETSIGTRSIAIPNYFARFLIETDFNLSPPRLAPQALDTIAEVWQRMLVEEEPIQLRVLELACGSANDYRALAATGLARKLDYTGLDICEKNIANARNLFPGIRFEVGNAFALETADLSYDCAFAHDLYEHLSVAAMEQALAELCRVTRRGFCLGFFNMHEEEEHVIQPVEDYHWNTLSLPEVRALLEAKGFSVQAIHLGTYLTWRFGCDQTHNKNAYTLVGRRTGSRAN